jgi:beta-galactosidase
MEVLEQRVLCARTETLIDAGWRFTRSSPFGANTVAFNDSAWGAVSLPHTWNAADGQDGGNNYYRGPAWYRKHLTVPAAQAGQRIFLKFDGANLVTELFVNGQSVGRHSGGYAAFTFDVTPFIHFGADNVLAVKMDNYGSGDVAPRLGDWTFFGGLYRDVHLITTSPVHVDLLDNGSSGVFLKQDSVSAASAHLVISSEVRNDNAAARAVTVSAAVLNATGATVKTLTTNVTVNPRSTLKVDQTTTILKPHLWNGLADPYLYKVRVKVADASGSSDQVEQPLGLRFYRVDPSTGFWLNGRPYDLHGVGFHQDRINQGFATTAAQRAQDLSFVKEIGATMVRLSHYPHAQDVFDGLDRMGVVTWAEVPLFEDARDTAGYNANVQQQLRELIRQNCNHPAVFFWGIFNEPNDTAINASTITQLNNLAHAEDPTRLTTIATDIPQASTNWKADLTGFNEYLGWYYGQWTTLRKFFDDTHAAHPAQAIGLSEYGAGGSISQHQVPPARPVPGGKFHPEEYQNLFHETYWLATKDLPYLWCNVTWSLFDFAGDARREGDANGRNDKGLVTYDHKTRKDAFYWYKANWSSSPVLYITSRRFTGRTVAATQVKVYSNLTSVTLTINGKTYGAKTSTNKIFTWDVTLSPGDNRVEVSATKGATSYKDSCVWTLAGTAKSAAAAMPRLYWTASDPPSTRVADDVLTTHDGPLIG